MLKIEHLKKSYENFSLDCSLEVKKGHVTGLIGQNGAGKSTTFKAILGLISFDSGTINILGEYYGAAEPPVRCGESHLSGLTEPLRSL